MREAEVVGSTKVHSPCRFVHLASEEKYDEKQKAVVAAAVLEGGKDLSCWL
jgi:hypothetical protein